MDLYTNFFVSVRRGIHNLQTVPAFQQIAAETTAAPELEPNYESTLSYNPSDNTNSI